MALVVAAKINLVPLPAAKAVLTIEFDDLLDALAATPLILRHVPSAVEVMDRFILDHAKESAALDALRQSILQTDPARCCASSSTATAPTICRRGSRRSSATSPASGFTCHWRRARRRRGPGADLEPARSGARPVDGDEGRRQSRSRSSRTPRSRPTSCATTSSGFLQIVRGHGTVAGVYAHASVGCLHVRPVVNLKTAEGVRRFEAIANDIADLVLEFGGALSGEHGDGLVRGPFTREDVRPGAVRRVPHGQARRSTRTASSTPARSSTRRR